MTDITLTNFNVPVDMKRRFDVICHASGRTRTSVLVQLMTDYVLEEGKRLMERQRQLGDLDNRFSESTGLKGSYHSLDRQHRNNRPHWQTPASDEFNLPTSFHSDGREDW